MRDAKLVSRKTTQEMFVHSDEDERLDDADEIENEDDRDEDDRESPRSPRPRR